MTKDTALLSVEQVCKHFRLRSKWGEKSQTLKAVNGVSLQVRQQEVFCVVGESGCGKSTLARVIAGLYQPTAGAVYYDGRRVDDLSPAQRRPFRRALQMVFQNPQESLNPRMTVQQTLEEALRFYFPKLSAAQRSERMKTTLHNTGLDTDALTRYPHQFSGGQRQRISIARALIVQPQCIIADEPIAALDVSVQAQILNLLADLQEQHGLAYFFITHDLSVVERFGHRVAVMYLGAVCEQATAADLFERPRHPYTQILLQAAPRIGKPFAGATLTGEVPSPLAVPSGCAFHPRCPYANERCRRETPPLQSDGETQVACHAVAEGRV